MRGSMCGVRRLAAVMMVVGASSAALGQGEQSLNDLRRENARLQERIAELESRLAQAQEVVKRLERQTADLREDLRKAQEAGRAGAGTSTSGGEVNQPVEPEAPRAEVPDDWTAAPEALYAALVRSYENELGGTARDTEGEKRRYLNDARRWARLHSQRMRETVEWRVRVVEVEAQGNGAIATLEVIEPGSGLPIGDAFEMELRPREAAKVQEAPDQEMWTMTGVFVAKPTVDEESGEDRVFSARKLIGPFIAFDWEFNVRALTP